MQKFLLSSSLDSRFSQIYKSKGMQISVYNTKGTLICSNVKFGKIDYSKLPVGIYLIIIELKDGTKERHLIAV